MNFQNFCAQQQESDGQLVSVNNTFVISFGKPEGTSFNIDPEVIALFLRYLVDHHDTCRLAIENDPMFSASDYRHYQEKPYRALYRLVEGEDLLNTIKSLGGSQTKPLTKIISKMICFLAGIPYTKIEENTHFDIDAVTAALKNMPDDLRELAGGESTNGPRNGSDIKELFKNWLRGEKKLKEKSVNNYAVSGINKADAILYGGGDQRSIYDIRSPDVLAGILEDLQDHPEWVQINAGGNSMYIAAISHYSSFLGQLRQVVPLAKPFLLLAGISGTGKTRFVREQARDYDVKLQNFCIVPVRPDWHEPSDLLGYVTRLTGTPHYVATEVIKFVVRAWNVVAPNASAAGCGEIDYGAVPYWLCLDEMNLAPVEQYFADYLSVLESRKYDDAAGFECDALLGRDMFQQLAKEDEQFRKNLGVNDDDLWAYFLANGIQLPPNLIVAGTVNMDETTHGFSRKVLDRAITLDFGEFYPNDYDSFFAPTVLPVTFNWCRTTHATLDGLAGTWDADGEKSITFLKEVNKILGRTPFELAYRALNELLIQVACLAPANETELQAVWDDFLMMKILPRIEGDEDKLRSKARLSEANVLDELNTFLATGMGAIWTEGRKDFFRVSVKSDEVLKIDCRSKGKIDWMRNKLEVNTFTSFWP